MIIINDSFKDTYLYLKQNNLEYINILVISGSFIEGMYILTQTNTKVEKAESLMKVIVSQKVVLGEIIKLAEPFKNNDSVKDIYAQLTALMECFGNVKVTMDSKQLDVIKKEVEKIKESLI